MSVRGAVLIGDRQRLVSRSGTAANTAAFACLVWALVQNGRTMAPGAG
jgi:hypothetical protein